MKKTFPAYIRVPLIFFAVFGAMEYFIDSGDQPAFIKYPMVLLFLAVFLFLLIAVEIVLSAVNKVTHLLLTDEEKAKALQAEESGENGWYSSFMQKLTHSRKIEEEGELLLDHNYDGIKELDNVLPPWWVWLFYGTIIFAVIYLVRYEILGAPNQEEELKNEMAQAKTEVEAYMKNAPDKTDEATVTLLTDAPSLAEGKTIFTTNCIACHKADGGGAIGPNLTDNQWILGGGIKNVFHTITNGGRDGKGMIAWSKNGMKGKDIQKVASYVLSLQGSNPVGGKAPEGEVWVEPTATAPVTTAPATATTTPAATETVPAPTK